MPKYSPRVANNFMLLSLILGNSLVFALFSIAAVVREFSGTQALDFLFSTSTLIIATQLGVTILPFLVYLRLTKQTVLDVLPLKAIGGLSVLLVVLITFAVMPLATLSALATMLVFNIDNNVADVIGSLTQAGLFTAFVAAVIVPSIFEEVAVRGVVLSNYRHISTHKAALVNGLFFGIFHLNPIQFLYAFLLGYVFALLVIYSGSIYSAILAHLVFNGSQVLLAYASQLFLEGYTPAQDIPLPEAGTPEMLIYGLVAYIIIAGICTPIAVFLLRKFKKINALNVGTHSIHTQQEGIQGEQSPPDTRIVTLSFVLLIVAYVAFIIRVYL